MICEGCNREMLNITTRTCVENKVITYADGVTLAAVPYKNPYFSDREDPDHRCHDCGIALGGFHHTFCDMEECPRCGGQLLSCDCPKEYD